ncbi:hypothetical protein CHH28_16555 [Bacterioplanes sanyensis]|uniref:Chalcone isomerase domain-containing protein n=1 Tax=Bacterioplanes sanyensis TaxID=1249553 RepID=A0A222FMD5_9GAMM|nr:hypothetical protein [Bacterioplanes sanyensis]ASP40187.1 hypothetical protein CHH28_16555 [Bacterioplanes sanyensis]
MVRRLLMLMLGTTMAVAANAAELEGIGVFEKLNKPWFLTALYSDAEPLVATPDGLPAMRLELKVVEEKISARKFRQLWLEALAVVHSDDALVQLDGDLERFASVVRGELTTGDHIVLEQRGDKVVVSLNYLDHAELSAEFLPTLVNTLTARIAPIPALKRGLTGELSANETRQLLNQFDRLEPSLRRISQTRRWQAQSDVQLSTL